MRALPAGVSWWWVVGGLVFVPALAAGLTVLAIEQGGELPGDATPSATEAAATTAAALAEPTVTREGPRAGLLDGVAMSEQEWEARRSLAPIAVVVDNTAQGYPQFGLDRAELVIEAHDGERLLALYWRIEAERVEPVAALEPVMADLAAEFGAITVHTGGDAGSATGFTPIDALDRENAQAFRRTLDHAFPHNLALSTEAVRALRGAAGAKAPAFAAWPRKRDFEGTTAADEIEIIQVNYGTSLSTEWRWDDKQNQYARFQDGRPHIDGLTRQQLRFKAVIVLERERETDRSGELSLFQDGRVQQGTWRFEADGLRLLQATGQPIALNRGAAWLAVVGSDADVIAIPPRTTPPPPVVQRPPAGSGGGGSNDFEPEATATPRPQATATPSASVSPSATASRSPTAPVTPGTVTPVSPSPTSGGGTSTVIPPTVTPTATPPPATATPTP